MLINLIIIQLIIVFVTDLTDFPNTIYKALSYILTKGKFVVSQGNLHLVSCSLCQVWWLGLIYLIITHSVTIPALGFVLLLAFLTPVAKELLYLIKDILIKILDIIRKYTIK